jgi:SAM-dependent methyltransferase
MNAQPHDSSLYQDTAPYYARARPPYSSELVPTLTHRLGLDGTGRMLDAGSGPGILSFAFADVFAEVVGLDPDPGMLAEAARLAAEGGKGNMRWQRGRAEDIPELDLGTFQLVTFGQSFHWTDRPATAEAVYAITDPGGALAIISHTSTDRPAPPGPGLPRIPLADVEEALARFLGPKRRAGKGLRNIAPEPHQDVLAASSFGPPERLVLPGREDLVRTPDDILANLYSTSFAAPHLFKDRREEFENELRTMLAKHSAQGLFWEWPGDTEVLLCMR